MIVPEAAVPRDEAPLVPDVNEALPRIEAPEGLLAWIASVDHKQIGIMYMIFAFVFFVVGGLEALLMRIQLGAPGNSFLSPALYNQLFTLHGLTMIFFAVMPILIGMANYFVPLMIGANDMAFPRLNAMSLWLFLFGGLLVYYSFITGNGPDVGWFAYPPNSNGIYSTRPGTNYLAAGLLVGGIGTVAGAINLIVTIIAFRVPGMTMRRLPAFVWMAFFTAVLIVLTFPSLNVALIMLAFDRLFGSLFFEAAQGGSPILYQHLFWGFGHPEVYVLILPAFGIISEVIPVFSRKPLYGYGFVIGSTIAITFYSLLVWGHHMWAVGMGFWADIFFSVATMIIAIPTGVKVFNWLATMYGGTVRFTTAMLFALGFLAVFPIGGVTGVQFAVVPFNRQITDTYYVVAHFHYVMFGGSWLAINAGIYYWFPKITGRLMNERVGRWHFWLTMLGFNLTFFVQHILGWVGMTRRIYTYPDNPGWAIMNQISTLGSFVLAVSVLVFLWNFFHSVRYGEAASENPWDAYTLEWATTSPPQLHNFVAVPPVRGRRPIWDLNHPEHADERTKDRESAGR